MSNTIYTTLEEVKELGIFAWAALTKHISDNEKWVKHISCAGATFHVISWSNLGRSCSEPNCIINKPKKVTE